MGRQEDLDRAFAAIYGKKEPAKVLYESNPVDVPAEYREKFVGGFVETDRRNRGSKPYTVAGSGGERVLVTWEDIKAIMDRKLHVGQIRSKQGDGSRPYAVFSKRECAAEIAEMVNRRFNSQMGEK